MIHIVKAVTMVLIAVSMASAAAPLKEVHRFLLVAGANDGGQGRATLRYAVTDAKAVAAVLTEMGGIDEQNKVFLSQPNAADMRRGFSSIENMLKNPKYADGRKEIVVYYSGHADEKGLRLGKELMEWPDLRKAIDNIDADLKIAIIDACGSGAITRIKGGVARPAFLSDASSDMKGYAFLTSSSESEVSQESDRIRGSFFTNALVSGLRGAADMTGSGTVTLSEAYQFAFNQTLESTQLTIGGAQHPSRDINLTGTGDVVMTDLRQINSGLTLDAGLEGRLFIRDERGFLVAELYKHKGRAVELGLPAGRYNIHMEHYAAYSAENLTLANGEKITLTKNMMRPVRREVTRKRGDEGDGQSESGNYYQRESANPLLDSARSALPTFESQIAFTHSSVPSNGTQLSLFVNDAGAEFAGTQISAISNMARKDMIGLQVSGVSNFAHGRFYGAQASIFNFLMHGEGSIQAGVVNAAKDVGIQAGVVNSAKNAGTQVGVVNAAKDVGYIQAGNVNIAENVNYIQAGNVNIADNVGYLQVGNVNIAKNVDYIQAGVVNMAGKVNRQIGLVNIARYSEKTPIGLVNIIGNGIFTATFYGDEAHLAGVTLNTGTPWLYTLFEYSQPPRRSFEWYNEWPKTAGWGLGTRFGMRAPFYMNLDLTAFEARSENPFKDIDWKKLETLEEQLEGISKHWFNNMGYKIRIGASCRLLPYTALTAGVSVNGVVEDKHGNIPIEPKGTGYLDVSYKDHNARIWPGYYAGLTVGRF